MIQTGNASMLGKNKFKKLWLRIIYSFLLEEGFFCKKVWSKEQTPEPLSLKFAKNG